MKADAEDVKALPKCLIGNGRRLRGKVFLDVFRAVAHDQLDGDLPETGLTVHEDRRGIVFLPVDLAEYVAAALLRHLLLGGEPPHDNPHPDPPAFLFGHHTSLLFNA
jgi:hypothetical protein